MQELKETEIELVSGAGFWKDVGNAFGLAFRASMEAVNEWPSGSGQEHLYTL